jgi:hypothetical protein
MNQTLEKALDFVTPRRLAWLIIAFGAVLRAVQYFSNSALYVDEGALALNVINRGLVGFLRPLDLNQAAPPGFLALEKIAIAVLGNTEYALRLFPFLFSLAALVLFYQTARRVLAAWAVPVALLFFAVSEQLIYFSAQVKQYSGDVAMTLLIVLIGLHVEMKELTARRIALLALTGGIVVWISHPSVFTLAGVGTTLALVALRNKQWLRLGKIAFCSAFWLASFAVFYAVSLRQLSANQRLDVSWMNKGTFMPLPPTSCSDLGWFFKTFFGMFSNPADLPFPIAAGLVFAAGCVGLFLKRKTHLLMLASPLLFTLLASGLHKYPFGRRLLLFAVPLLLIILVSGIEFIVERARPVAWVIGFVIVEVLLFQIAANVFAIPSSRRPVSFIAISVVMIVLSAIFYIARKPTLYARSLGAVILFCLLLQPVGGATRSALNPPVREDVRPVLAYVKDHRQPGDLIYVYHHHRASFLYYAPKYGFTPDDYVLGEDERTHWDNQENPAYTRDLDQLRGRRVWFVFSFVRTIAGVNEEEYLVRYLYRIGSRLDGIKHAGASAYLYDLAK